MRNQILSNLCDQKRRHLMQFALVVAATVAISTTSAVFADNGISDAIKSLMSSFYGEIIRTAIVVVPVYIAFVAITLIGGGRTAWDKFRTGIIAAGVCILVVYVAPVMVSFIIGAANSISGTGESGFASLDPDYKLPEG